VRRALIFDEPPQKGKRRNKARVVEMPFDFLVSSHKTRKIRRTMQKEYISRENTWIIPDLPKQVYAHFLPLPIFHSFYHSISSSSTKSLVLCSYITPCASSSSPVSPVFPFSTTSFSSSSIKSSVFCSFTTPSVSSSSPVPSVFPFSTTSLSLLKTNHCSNLFNFFFEYF